MTLRALRSGLAAAVVLAVAVIFAGAAQSGLFNESDSSAGATPASILGHSGRLEYLTSASASPVRATDSTHSLMAPHATACVLPCAAMERSAAGRPNEARTTMRLERSIT